MKSISSRYGFVCGYGASIMHEGKRRGAQRSLNMKFVFGFVALSLPLLLMLSVIYGISSSSSNLSATKSVQPLTTYHNITIDANLSDWHNDENLTGKDNANWYLTWNETTIFVGVSRGETFHGSTDDYDVLWVYMDTTSGGTTTSVDWNGMHTLPFSADWCFVFKPRPYGDTDYYWNLRYWNGSGWQTDMPYTGNGGYPAWHWDNGTAEIAIPFADINITTSSAIKVVLYFTNGANNWLFGATPVQNPTGASPQVLTAYWNYSSLGSGIAPNSSGNIVPEASMLSAVFVVVPVVLRYGRKKTQE